MKDIEHLRDSGKLAHVGQGTLKKDQPLMEIYRGEGMTYVAKKLPDETEEFVTLIESGKGMDLGIFFLKDITMKFNFDDLMNNIIEDVMVSGYIDTETPPVFHPMYEKIYFFINKKIFEMQMNDGIIVFYKLKKIRSWFELDENDTFSLMSIYSQLFNTEQPVLIKAIDYNGTPFSNMVFNYTDDQNEKCIGISPNNFFGFSFFCN